MTHASRPRLLLVPVSGPRGMGEFARALAVGNAVQRRWPDVELKFIVHRDAPYAATLGHPVTLVPASPTLCTPEFLQELRDFRPDVVYFDNSGRTRQLQAARAAGARLVYVSSRGRQRYKAFRLRWMKALDEHWISYSAALAGELTWLERLKLRACGRPRIRFLDAVLAPADPAGAAVILGAMAEPIDVTIVPGGGSQYPDSRITPRMFAQWGEVLAARGWNVLFVAGPSFAAEIRESPRLRRISQVSGGVLVELLRHSRLVLVNGGDTLVQALAIGVPCVAVPIAGDQAERIKTCVRLGAVIAPPTHAVIEECDALLKDPARLVALRTRVGTLGFRDAMPGIVESLGRMLGLV